MTQLFLPLIDEFSHEKFNVRIEIFIVNGVTASREGISKIKQNVQNREDVVISGGLNCLSSEDFRSNIF